MLASHGPALSFPTPTSHAILDGLKWLKTGVTPDLRVSVSSFIEAAS
eukprot:CAMPEP_0171935044 /NCGR_PEP_ID=MMETSP0993-20121228/32544_1 /TAXON_ID=483369 /ORGANISM="non described non described, Strain CCMP2098" /LENGTH=46 /DNA_ID= /DNA_START= /DNA_END= /DNA_ORIENTATION=